MLLNRSRALLRLFALLSAVMLLAAAFAPSVLADPRDFDLVNNTSITIVRAYVSATDVDSWEEDVLGEDVLYPGESITVNFSGFDGDTCLYDVKVVGEGGEEGYLYQVDLCSTTTVTFSDG
jgi:hypothetical protein